MMHGDDILLTFARTMATIAAEGLLLAAGVLVRAMPAPGAIRTGSSNCLRLPAAQAADGIACLRAEQIDVEGIYLPEGEAFCRMKAPLPRFFSDLLGIGVGDSVGIIGCGGKTSLMERLAGENSLCRVLMTTTTHIRRPDSALYDREIRAGDALLPGINLLHGGDVGHNKLQGPSSDALGMYAARNALLLMEADGSRCLPLKGWADYEPVLPPFTSVTLGVCSVGPVGETVSEATVHRLARYCALTGEASGDKVTAASLAAMVGHPRGMFWNARGRQALLINQVESGASRSAAAALAAALPAEARARLSVIACGSLQEGTGEVLYGG